MTSELRRDYQAELQLMRQAYAGVAARANTAFALVQRISQSWLWLPREATLSHLAANLYFSAGTDACERYESVDEFQTELTSEVDAAWLEQPVIDGECGYLIRPYFSGGVAFAGDLNIGYLNCGPLSAVASLDVPVTGFIANTPVYGATESELQDVIKGVSKRVLNMVNTLRNLVTALNYVQSDVDSNFKRGSREPLKLRVDEQLAPLLAELQSVIKLPIGHVPARHFSSDSNRVNALASLTNENLVSLAGNYVAAEPAATEVSWLQEQLGLCESTLESRDRNISEILRESARLSAENSALKLAMVIPANMNTPPARVLISPRPGGFTLAAPVLAELYLRFPDYFDEPLSASEFSSYAKAYPDLPAGEAIELAIPGLLIRGTDAFFLKSREADVRADAWLLSEFDRLGAVAFSGNARSGLKTVIVPGGISWGIHEEDNGSESVRESHRVWD